jgi:glucose/arabinose dehydrogenase
VRQLLNIQHRWFHADWCRSALVDLVFWGKEMNQLFEYTRALAALAGGISISVTRTLRVFGPALLLFSSAEAWSEDGEQLYQTHCSACHGVAFQGSGLAPALSVDSYRYGGRREDFVRIIGDGILSMGMPAFADTLSEAELLALSEYLPARTAIDADETIAGAENQRSDNVSKTFPKRIQTLDHLIEIDVFADDLVAAWGIDFLDETTALITDKNGQLRVVRNGLLAPEAVEATPLVLADPHRWNQGGLLDVAVHPEYSKNGWIYLSYSHERSERDESENALRMLRVVRGRIESGTWIDEETVFEADASAYGELSWHYGGRMIFDRAGFLYLTIGDRGKPERARNLEIPHGKILRLHPDGRVPSDNPYAGAGDVLPQAFTFGHRHPQGLAMHPGTGEIWSLEHGPRGGDELNILRAGADYGWPIASYGINYDGTLLTPDTHVEGTEQPVTYWRPSIGVSGGAFYDGDMFENWVGKLLVTGLGSRDLRLLTVERDRVIHQEVLLEIDGRPYEPVIGPDGAIYVVTSEPGRVLRLSAKSARKQ